MLPSIISERLTELRRERKLTQIQVATFCDITEKTYQNYELMTRMPRIEILIRLADYYDVSLDYLTGRSSVR